MAIKVYNSCFILVPMKLICALIGRQNTPSAALCIPRVNVLIQSRKKLLLKTGG